MHLCLFDIDGTLLSSGGAGRAAMGAALATAFGVPDATDGVPFSGRTDRAITRDLFGASGVDDTPANWQRFVAAYLEHLPGCLHGHRGAVLPGIMNLLQRLSQRDDLALGLLTGNLRDGARLKLAHYGLFHHFAFGGFGDHHFDRDAVAQEALHAARSHLEPGTNLRSVWVVGDTPLDIACARSIGAQAVAVATGWHSLAELAAAQPDLLLADLSDPTPLLSCWQACVSP